MRALVASLAVLLVCTGIGACSGGESHDLHVVLARDLTATLPPGSPQVTARRVQVGAGSRLIRPLTAAEHVAAAGRLGGRAVLTFHVGHVSGRPFLAWLNGATWVPVPSSYNAKAGTVSATVSHFSTWAPFTWAISQIRAWVRSEIGNFLGVGTATEPTCDPASGLVVTDSNPSHHTIGACAEPASPAAAAGTVIIQVANLRGYPVDLSYPALVNGLCGEYGKCVKVRPDGDEWLKVGSALSPGSNKILLPGSSTATVIVGIPGGQTVTLRTAVDEPAMFMAFLEVGVGVLASIIGKKIEAVETTGDALGALATSQCLADDAQQGSGPLTLGVAASLATTAFGCVSSELPDVLDKLGLKESGLILGGFGVAADLIPTVLSSVWGVYDAFFGSHVLAVGRASCPSAAVIKQALAQQLSWWRPGYTVLATTITCAGPYVVAGAQESPQIGGGVLIEQEASGLKVLTVGSGPLCTTIAADALPGQIIYVPLQYGHALGCVN